MERRRFNWMLSKEELEHGRGLSKSLEGIGPIGIGNTNGVDSDSSNNVDHLFGVSDIRNLISDVLVRDNSNGENYSIYFDIENMIFEIEDDRSFLNELKSFFSSYLNDGSKSDNHYYDRYMYDTQSSWNNHITSCITNYLRSEIHIDSYFYSSICIYSSICNESVNSIGSDFDMTNGSDDDRDDLDMTNGSDFDMTNGSDFDMTNGSDFDMTNGSDNDMTNGSPFYKRFWVLCEDCNELNYKRFLRLKLNVCEHCEFHLKMHSSERIELLMDPGTWDAMDEGLASVDPIEFHSEEDPYKDRIDSYQKNTGLTEAVQTGVGQLNGISIAIGIMDFQFMGGSMGSVVGEKITRLIEYATNRSLPLIIVCASGGARMQEGSLSLMQMAKISSASYNYQSNKKLFYVSILTSPTTGGVTASFGMLGDIIIAEPNAYIAFAGKRVIEQTLNKEVPEGSQEAEYLFDKGLFDPIVPRNPLKGVLGELFQLHGFFPLNQNSIEIK
uniref:Acetyl-coenzyme A carboxylase carboxyl transferase subunit beta, chloroplastic n=1 Tax=Aquilegia rockii TaxID=1291456 RepID=A0A6G6DA86_9MAGN|nr:acetyl-CoA carboxylase carboxyltransferase beta subunit [Aquilegia rockii]QZJ20905.1 acetyl-CoA carboxylase carboxyltransferase beta subunit [Aquilegia ecalcarata]QZJ21715.1 acetyl-CoA carboxylase carboxyltransferase beta subunit [Aquilegia kansuensis]QZJ22768.1 acetyl-CoA carboxylase carboxyltransferase beta subunit [Aquilegia yangii]QZJ37429.1 acetyl-CoA carboxylase carboxyltransferase beta subunit [Aquilegia yabeana]QIE13456.1 acetyl-CoA carboxylase carboxyltransferase beta subunit [Aqui